MGRGTPWSASRASESDRRTIQSSRHTLQSDRRTIESHQHACTASINWNLVNKLARNGNPNGAILIAGPGVLSPVGCDSHEPNVDSRGPLPDASGRICGGGATQMISVASTGFPASRLGGGDRVGREAGGARPRDGKASREGGRGLDGRGERRTAGLSPTWAPLGWSSALASSGGCGGSADRADQGAGRANHVGARVDSRRNR